MEALIQELPKFRLKAVPTDCSECPICLEEFHVGNEVLFISIVFCWTAVLFFSRFSTDLEKVCGFIVPSRSIYEIAYIRPVTVIFLDVFNYCIWSLL